ncbi:nucleoid occlusion factor SlmA [Xylophilus sp. GOD-11R]|uniref:nucleoid occlusion factor SlmA n=1 Tax=Xylophilus sp. GOD-11R TaxID=3089814 RepID=UPI00298CF927|nr:nucleoid occlusion factor SlmA [Xylophilus sp. GOD-11R]WPB59123.1 nucleoid occlusion factor SlmA [Xylophilus sp. GOD-11R]
MDRVNDGFLRSRGGTAKLLDDCIADASRQEAARAEVTRALLRDLKAEFQGRRADAPSVVAAPVGVPTAPTQTPLAAPAPNGDFFLAGPGRKKLGERRRRILACYVSMLADKRNERITTAALAQFMELSEAALYRNFASKGAMLESLIDAVEDALFAQIEQIDRHAVRYRLDTRSHVAMLVALPLKFAEAYPGASRLMAGDALAVEDSQLRNRMTMVFVRFESTLLGALLRGESVPKRNPAGLAAALCAFSVGRMLRFSNSGFADMPTADLDACLEMMLR